MGFGEKHKITVIYFRVLLIACDYETGTGRFIKRTSSCIMHCTFSSKNKNTLKKIIIILREEPWNKVIEPSVFGDLENENKSINAFHLYSWFREKRANKQKYFKNNVERLKNFLQQVRWNILVKNKSHSARYVIWNF